MAHRVAWSKRALHDLEAIAEYIAADSQTYAGIVVKKVVSQTKMLARFPRAGRKVPEFDDENVRELMVYSYRIIYRLEDDEVVIAAVIHGKRILQ
ncbi:MAG TPA: type II toxin-antitoxin system RelE/ParE family toxin [Terriglobales bacterium]|nr:type II toxin-antitoxin system RelE/ParE family toxin [Terriglobales bacterium]